VQAPPPLPERHHATRRLTTPSAGPTRNHPRWMAQCSPNCCTASSEHRYGVGRQPPNLTVDVFAERIDLGTELLALLSREGMTPMIAWRTKWIRTLSSAASAGPCAGCVDSPASLDEGPFRRILLRRASLGVFREGAAGEGRRNQSTGDYTATKRTVGR